MTQHFRGLAATLALAGLATMAYAHGDVAPQPVNTDALPEVGEEWLIENPYRAEKAGDEVWWTAVTIGDSAYNQNCARCHGLGVVPEHQTHLVDLEVLQLLQRALQQGLAVEPDEAFGDTAHAAAGARSQHQRHRVRRVQGRTAFERHQRGVTSWNITPQAARNMPRRPPARPPRPWPGPPPCRAAAARRS